MRRSTPFGPPATPPRGSTLVVTLEPCCHLGKTPPCTDAVIASRVARVVVATEDPFPRVAGRGIARLREAGIEVVVGVLEREARDLNAPFFKRIATGRPFVIAKWAMTLDGRIASALGDSRWISNELSRAAVHEVRGRMDAICVGIGTALADDPSLTARPPGPRTPVRLVLDPSARLPIGSRLVATAREAPTWVAVTRNAPESRVEGLIAAGCEVLRFDEEDPVPIRPLLDELGRRGMTNVLIEGGGRVLGAFFDAREIDEVDVFVAPILVGGPANHVPIQGLGMSTMAEALRLGSIRWSERDGDLRLQGRLPRADGDVSR